MRREREREIRKARIRERSKNLEFLQAHAWVVHELQEATDFILESDPLILAIVELLLLLLLESRDIILDLEASVVVHIDEGLQLQWWAADGFSAAPRGRWRELHCLGTKETQENRKRWVREKRREECGGKGGEWFYLINDGTPNSRYGERWTPAVISPPHWRRIVGPGPNYSGIPDTVPMARYLFK